VLLLLFFFLSERNAEFDSSYARGSPTTFAPNQVIKGWTEAMQLMVEGDKLELYIPSELAYGDSGSGAKIPGATLFSDFCFSMLAGDFTVAFVLLTR
jgi:FKBP-type peptidyl-prolyl cis-trans isomerase FklB